MSNKNFYEEFLVAYLRHLGFGDCVHPGSEQFIGQHPMIKCQRILASSWVQGSYSKTNEEAQELISSLIAINRPELHGQKGIVEFTSEEDADFHAELAVFAFKDYVSLYK